jgi:phosphoglycerate dehydrogenase-like enzyme
MTSDVWLPIPADEIEGLPDPSDSGLNYLFWDGGPDFPADPADCAFYAVPYMKGMEVAVRPLAAMTSVRVVQTLSAGIDHVEPGLGSLPAGVRLCNARGVHEASTAELTLALILASLRGVPGFVRGQDKEEWRSGFYPALADKSVLIVGYGSIGASIESRLSGFEANVVRVARSARDGVHSVSELPELLPLADIVILIVPSTDETTGMADAEFLAQMKDGALLVNAARGPVVDTAALLAELEAGRLRAALDVTDPEPLPEDHPLWVTPGAFITPHVGGSTPASAIRAAALVRDQLTRFAKGEQLHNVITGEY